MVFFNGLPKDPRFFGVMATLHVPLVLSLMLQVALPLLILQVPLVVAIRSVFAAFLSVAVIMYVVPVVATKDATIGLVTLGSPHTTDLIAVTAMTFCFFVAGVPLVAPWLGVTSPVQVPAATRTVHVIAESLSTQEPVLMVEPCVA
jgi:hypothetical protein